MDLPANRLSGCSTKNKNYSEFIASEGERKRVKVCQPLKKSVKKKEMTMEMIREFLKTADAQTCSDIHDMSSEREEVIENGETEGEYVPIRMPTPGLSPPEGWKVYEEDCHGVIWTDGEVFVAPCEDVETAQKWVEYSSDETSNIILVKVK
tara:strand:- start:798 stop:1250 length:453 start_codon:yes stop_codon:yes gene_type:complete